MLIISADAMMGRYMIVMGRWNYIFGHRPTGDVPGIPDGQSAPGCNHGRQFGLKCAGDRDAFGSAFLEVLGTMRMHSFFSL